MEHEQASETAVDAFAALEQRVIRAIELLNGEREQRASAERQVEDLRGQLEAQQAESEGLRRELNDLHHERSTVRTRVERLMASLDAIETA